MIIQCTWISIPYSEYFFFLHFGNCSYHDNAFAASRALHIVNALNKSATFPLLESFFKHQVNISCFVLKSISICCIEHTHSEAFASVNLDVGSALDCFKMVFSVFTVLQICMGLSRLPDTDSELLVLFSSFNSSLMVVYFSFTFILWCWVVIFESHGGLWTNGFSLSLSSMHTHSHRLHHSMPQCIHFALFLDNSKWQYLGSPLFFKYSRTF